METLIFVSSVVLLISVFLSFTNSEDSGYVSRMVHLESRIEKCVSDLDVCEAALRANDGTYLGQVCQWIGNPNKHGKSTLKKTVHNFLKATQIDKINDIEMDVKELDVIISLSQNDLLSLKRFLLNDEGKEDTIQDILARSFTKPKPRHRTWVGTKSLTYFLQHEGFVVFQIVICALILIFGLWKGVAVWKVSIVLVVGSVAWTWIRLYKTALAKKQATLQRLGQVPQTCLLEKNGWFNSLTDAFYGVLGVKDNKCEVYYEALMVDPFWEVTPLVALSETVSQFVLRPLELCGASLGTFFNEILAPMPLVWKIPVLLIAMVIILLLLLMGCRYKIKSPLLFSIEPSERRSPVRKYLSDNKKDSKRVKQNKEDEERKRLKKETRVRTKEEEEPLPYPSGPNIIDHLVQ